MFINPTLTINRVVRGWSTRRKICVIQENTTSTSYVKKHTYKSSEDDKCRPCTQHKGTIKYLWVNLHSHLNLKDHFHFQTSKFQINVDIKEVQTQNLPNGCSDNLQLNDPAPFVLLSSCIWSYEWYTVLELWISIRTHQVFNRYQSLI